MKHTVVVFVPLHKPHSGEAAVQIAHDLHVKDVVIGTDRETKRSVRTLANKVAPVGHPTIFDR